MDSEREAILSLVKQLNDGLAANTLTPEQEEKLRDEIGDLQMNVIIGDLLTD